MSREREEAQLRAALALLRRRDEALARPFPAMWSAAERRANTGARARPQRWIAVPALALLIVVIALSYRAMRVDQPSQRAPEMTEHGAPRTHLPATPELDISRMGRLRIAPYVDPLSAWRSPTGFLLTATDRELLRSVPRFGRPAIDPIPLPNQEI